jgi:REP element-mobilizing transposase RayT
MSSKLKLYYHIVLVTKYRNSIISEYTDFIKQITKILNNTKFKHNLNKLNNIDFL